MAISRRTLLRQIGAGTAGAAAIPLLPDFCLAERLPSPEAAARGSLIRLNKNESAYGPSEKSVAAMQSGLSLSNRYPGSEIDDLTNKIASLHNVKPAQVTLGAGSREILRMAAAAFLRPGKRLVLGSPTFDAIAHFASSSGAEVAAVPLTKTYAHDLDAMLARANASSGLIYICNPNNPTGTLSVRKDIEVFLRKVTVKSPIVIDEAYHEYVSPSPAYASFLDHPIEDERVIVVRTFSKIYGLAGLRVGYGISSPQLARTLSACQLLFGVNVIGARAAAAALDGLDHVRLSARRNTDDRQEFFNQANARMNRWIDSHTNFVMLKGGLPPQQVVEHFRSNHILLGPLIPEMSKYVRVSLGKPEEMLEFWRVWDMLPPHEMAM
jgi:histidinol-phosphate aminotransferase